MAIRKRPGLKQLFTLNEVTISYRPMPITKELSCANRSDCVASLLRDVWSDDIEYREEFYILLLNQALKPIGIRLIGSGATNACIVDAKMVFQAALKGNAASIILAHNHPSGSLVPSRQDIELTKKLVAAGKLLDIRVLDHLILTGDSYYSFQDDGIMP